ncbi:hypothetical protein ABPG75_013898 [Micractinium tetrahymenae]
MESLAASSSHAARHGPASLLEALLPDLLAAAAAQLGPGPADRLRLAAASRSLLAASRQRSPSWWGRLEVELPSQEAADAFAAWLAARRPAVQELGAEAQFGWRDARAFALPDPPKPEVESTWQHLPGLSSCLIRLEIGANWPGGIPPEVASLTGLCELQLYDVDWPCPGWRHLSGLRYLTQLELSSCSLARLWLNSCTLSEVPPDVASMSALRELKIVYPGNSSAQLQGGWEHLSALSRLSSLILPPGVGSLPQFLTARPGLCITRSSY